MRYLGLFRRARTQYAQELTGETFISIGPNAVSGKDVCACGGILALAEGEIRNTEALMRDLRLTGVPTGAEMILAAYRTWGADYPRHVEGCVMSAVIDRAEDRLLLVRDRTGVIPVYYSWRGRSAAFAGRPELLLKLGMSGRLLTAEGLNELFCMGGAYSFGRTPFQDIRRLEPGCALVSDGRGMRTVRYFSLKPEESCMDFESRVEALLPEAGAPVYAVVESAFLSGLYERKGLHPALTMGVCPRGGANECLAVPSGGIAALLGEAAQVFGFPGDARGDIFRVLAAKRAAESGAGLILGVGQGLFGRRARYAAGNLTRFMRDEVKEALRPASYVRNRLREALDRLSLQCPSRLMALAALHALPADAVRWAHACSQFDVAFRMPFMDASVLSAVAGGYNISGEASVESEFLPAKEVCEEALSMAEDACQPVFKFLSREAVQREVRMEKPAVDMLASIIEINIWLMETEAEAEGGVIR